MELTKEYFDQVVAGLARKADIEQAVVPLATKKDVREGVEKLARMVSTGFDEMRDRLDVTDKLSIFERKFQRLEEALHIKL
jgi:hypothetical protein